MRQNGSKFSQPTMQPFLAGSARVIRACFHYHPVWVKYIGMEFIIGRGEGKGGEETKNQGVHSNWRGFM